jgi:hypothetical protein
VNDLLEHDLWTMLAEPGRASQADISGQDSEVAGVLVPGFVSPQELAGTLGLQVDRVLGGEGLVQD